jgi:hypothetical protein
MGALTQSFLFARRGICANESQKKGTSRLQEKTKRLVRRERQNTETFNLSGFATAFHPVVIVKG